jgi:phytanoyl-CoA hydroxylase
MFDRDAGLRTFREKGYLVVPGVLSRSEMEPIRNAIGDAVERQAEELWQAGKITERHQNATLERRLALLYRGIPREASIWNSQVFGRAVYDLLTHPAILEIVEMLIGPEITVNGDYWVRPKMPEERSTTYHWHQDSAYYGAGSENAGILTVWIPLVDTDEQNGCLQALPASHQWGLQPARSDPETGQLVPAVDPELRARPETLPMHAGDVLAFSELTYHKSLMNHSENVRWSIDLRYTSTDAPLEGFWKRWPGFVARSRRDPGGVEPFEVRRDRRA